MKKLILLIEDDPAVQRWLAERLPKNLFLLETAETSRSGIDLANSRRPDVILLDWNLPGWSGLDLCKYLKQNKSTSHIPVLMLTGYDRVQNKVQAFNAGADDYITKPFEAEELIARIKAVLRRNDAAPDDILRVHGIALNLTGHSVEVDKKKLSLTATEFGLLHTLMRSPGRVLTRKFLLERVWGYSLDVSTRTVDVYVRRLRMKLGPKQAACIQSAPGLGYKFKADAARRPATSPLPWEAKPDLPVLMEVEREAVQSLA